MQVAIRWFILFPDDQPTKWKTRILRHILYLHTADTVVTCMQVYVHTYWYASVQTGMTFCPYRLDQLYVHMYNHRSVAVHSYTDSGSMGLSFHHGLVVNIFSPHARSLGSNPGRSNTTQVEKSTSLHNHYMTFKNIN